MHRSAPYLDLHLVLPTYLQVTDAALISSDPPLFRASIGTHASQAQELTLTGSQWYFLSLSDGSRTSREISALVEAEFGPEPTLADWWLDLVKHGVLTFAERHPEVLPDRDDRYARHGLFYQSIGAEAGATQARLQASTVAVLGVGGIGTWAAYLLAAAGVGHLRLIDGDVIEESNLTRQVLFQLGDVGRSKVEVARERLLAQRPDLDCSMHTRAIGAEEDLDEALGRPDLVLLSGNSPRQIHDWVDRWAVRTRTPWLRAGYAHARAMCGPLIVPGRTSCVACVTRGTHDAGLNQLPFVKEINDRFQVPSFGPVNGLAAAMASKEIIAWLSGIEHAQAALGALLVMDSLTMESQKIVVPRNPDCTRCGALEASS